MITFIPLTGFLGAGKTTTMTAAALALQAQGRKVAVITNDQGVELVDTKLVRSKLDSVAEVTGGCFCCKFEDLVEAIVALVATDSVDTVIAEAVGSCTDLQATVVRPLRQYYGDDMVVAPLTTVVDPLRHLAFARAAERGEPESDLSYLFRQQVTEADVIAVNKLDTIKADRAEELLASLRTSNPKATVVGYSATTGAHLESLLDAWQAPATNEDVVLDIDYDRYAAAEAQLAWMNQELDLTAAENGFDATDWARTVLGELSAWAAENGAVIGHAKITVETADGDFAKLSLTESGGQPTLDRAATGPAPTGRAVVNARVACEPDALDAAVAELREGETVLDLGSGGGLDVILSARRVGPDGRVFGLDFLEEMLALAARNVEDAEVDNVVLLKGTIESIPLPADTVDVIISNCVINLSLNKPAVFAEMARVLTPGGRLGISDVVAEDRLSPEERAERGGHSQCIAGALSVSEYKELLDAVGLKDAEVVFTQEAADGLHAAIVRAHKPVDSTAAASECAPGGSCC